MHGVFRPCPPTVREPLTLADCPGKHWAAFGYLHASGNERLTYSNPGHLIPKRDCEVFH